jgi:hypothetical protein
MGDAKSIVVRPISSADARAVIRDVHYSGSVVSNSTLHLGVFVGGSLEGAMQFGSPMDRRKVLPLVRGTEWNQMFELNRMAFGERLPRNSESRALGVAFRMLRKHRPDIKWVLSFSDASQCGDGIIYRASGFVLTGVKQNSGLFRLPDGQVVQRMTLETARPTAVQERLRRETGLDSASSGQLVKAVGGVPVPGFQLRYIKFLDPDWVDRLTVPVIPFDKIPDGARMYRGQRVCAGPQGASGDHPDEGGAGPTPALHP